METTFGTISPETRKQNSPLDDVIECGDVGSMVIPVSLRYQQMARRLEQIERQLEHLVATDREFGVVGVPEDSAAMSSMSAS